MAAYFVHVLNGPASSYFIKNFAFTSTFSEIETVLLLEYNSDSSLIQVKVNL